MMQVPRREPQTRYVLRDTGGRALGWVVAPAGEVRTGPGAETVLLNRCPAAPERAVRTAA